MPSSQPPADGGGDDDDDGLAALHNNTRRRRGKSGSLRFDGGGVGSLRAAVNTKNAAGCRHDCGCGPSSSHPDPCDGTPPSTAHSTQATETARCASFRHRVRSIPPLLLRRPRCAALLFGGVPYVKLFGIM